jgi:hypothetical protein
VLVVVSVDIEEDFEKATAQGRRLEVLRQQNWELRLLFFPNHILGVHM